jgi:multidrug efflux pump subunit AcrA (membrane-fusion protein)
MRLSAPELVAQRAQAQAAVKAAESQLATAKARLLSDQGTYQNLDSAAKTPGVIAPNDLMVAHQTVEADQGAAAAAEHNTSAARDALRAVAQLESYLTVSAPFAGFVTARNLHPGALVGPASGQSGAAPILQIAETDRLRLVVPVPEAEAGAVKVGEKVAFTVPAYLGQMLQAPIARVSHDVNQQTRTMHIELEVDNRDGRLAAGG